MFGKYHDGSMTESEKTEFIRRLSEDPSFAWEFKIYNEVHHFVLNDEKRSEFISSLKETEKEYFNSEHSSVVKHKNKFTQSIAFRVAASVVIILATSLCIYFISNSKSSNKELFTQYYLPLKTDEITRSVTDSATSLKAGLIAYQNGQYNDCLMLLASDTIKNNMNTYITLIKGISNIELNDFINAEKMLKLASEDVNNAYHDDCLWFLSLVQIKMDKPQQAIPLLKTLIKNNSVYNKQAEELLEKIK